MAPLLDVEDIHTYYGDSHVLHGASLSVHEGQVVSLLGRNGVGKTTTLRSILGHTPPRRGTITFQGEDVTGLDPDEIAARGIGWVPEERRIFPALTVAENLELAVGDRDVDIERAFEHFPALADLTDARGRHLSGGEQQMLAIARGLLGQFEVLLIDEPTEGLAPQIVDDVVSSLEAITDDRTILLVEQNVEVVASISDYVYLMDNGEIVAETDDIERDAELVDRHLKVTASGE